jgi:uncharacterized protein YegL
MTAKNKTKQIKPPVKKAPKSRNTHTHVALVVDRSGSMGSCWKEMVPAVNTFLDQQKKAKGKCTLSMAIFDDQYDLLHDFKPIKEVQEPLAEIKPRGWTALLDAIGKTINSVEEKIKKLKPADRPVKVVFMTQTDGQENASSEFSPESIKGLIDKKTKEGWDFVFVGTTQQSVLEAQKYGFSINTSATYDADNSIGTMSLLGEKLKDVRASLIAGGAAVDCCYSSFTEEERKVLNKKKHDSKTV